MIELARPAVLWGLAVLAPYLVVRWRQTTRGAVRFAPLQHVPAPPLRTALLRWSVGLEAVVIAAAVLAMSGPFRSDVVETLSTEGLDVALVLDVSASMQAADFPPNRLEALKEVARELLSRSGGNRIGIVAFAGHVFTQSPLTTDHAVLSELVEGLAFESVNHGRSGGTAIGDALLVATDTLERCRLEGRDQVVVLITDGESNVGIDPLLAARRLRSGGLRLHVIGIGGDEEVEVSVHGKPFINTSDQVLRTALDDAQLEAVAAAAGGRYQRARDVDVLGAIFSELARLESTPLEVERLEVRAWLSPIVAMLGFAVFACWLAVNGVALRRPMR